MISVQSSILNNSYSVIFYVNKNNKYAHFAFCYSNFCMTEFDMAYHHNVAVKRKKRLIVLMMLDSPTDLYDNEASDRATLRQYLRQYTYIDYMADDWLDKLLYALPLRGLLQNNEEHNNDHGDVLLLGE